MEQPKVSVIIITYNQERLIGRAIQSALDQKSTFHYEIVVGEDCSSDGTLRVCRQYESRYPGRVRVMANRVNKGIQANYFDCVQAAKGTYIAELGGDDFWTDPHKLEKQVNILEANPWVSLVHTGWNYYNEGDGTVTDSDPDGKRAPFLKTLTNGSDLIAPLILHKAVPIVHSCTQMYRRDMLLKELKADSDLFRNPVYGCEDLQVAVAMARLGDVAYLPDVTLNYSVGKPSAVTADNELRACRFYYGTTRLMLDLSKKYGGVDEDELRQAVEPRLEYILAMAFRAGSSEYAARVKAICRELGIKMSVKSELRFRLTSNKSLWKLAKTLKK